MQSYITLGLTKNASVSLIKGNPMTPLQLAAIASPIASKFGLNKCRPCATALRDAFQEKHIPGSVLRLSTKGGRGYIVMKNSSFKLPFFLPPGVEAIADSGQHFGVLVGTLVFDNIFRSGVAAANWERQFDCDVHQFSLLKIEHF